MAREQARLYLGAFGVYYTWVVQMNALSLMNVFKQRLASDAQFETRAYAEAMYHKTFKPLLPWTAEAFEKFTMNKEG